MKLEEYCYHHGTNYYININYTVHLFVVCIPIMYLSVSRMWEFWITLSVHAIYAYHSSSTHSHTQHLHHCDPPRIPSDAKLTMQRRCNRYDNGWWFIAVVCPVFDRMLYINRTGSRIDTEWIAYMCPCIVWLCSIFIFLSSSWLSKVHNLPVCVIIMCCD